VTQYRNPNFSQLMMLVAVVFAIGGILISATRVDSPVVSRVAAAVVVLGLAAFVYFRMARAGVYAGDDGIRIVNPFATVEIPWPHLVRFTARPKGGFPLMGFAERVDGTEVQLWGVQARSGSAGSKRVVDGLIEQLNEHLAQVRRSSSA
jgi:Bacterial PH domain